jgi:3-isopropylmalate/(R)-2-methylmalate dehydratase small subunit
MVKNMSNEIEKIYGGKIFFLNRDNINTDEIIPAKYLTYIDKEPLQPHLLEDLKIEGLNPNKIKWNDYGVIITRANFGCGSSREMAVWAFEVNSINVVIASNFARIFRENAFNGGMLAIELENSIINSIFEKFSGKDEVSLQVDLDTMEFTITYNEVSVKYPFNLSKFEKDLVNAGGWVQLAQKYK